MIDYIIDNVDWIFSGIGIFILGIFLNFFFNSKNKKNQNQNIGDNSKGYQAGNDIIINENAINDK